MQHSRRWQSVTLIVVGLMTACQQKPEIPANLEPVRTEAQPHHSGQAVYRVRLTAKRAQEIGIMTAPVTEKTLSGKLCKVIPVAAVIHDPSGAAWAFKTPDSLVFVRERINIDHVERDLAILSDGPPVGTAVVIAGAQELLGEDFNKMSEEVVESKTQVGEQRKETGTATMQEDGAIKVVYKTTGMAGLSASVVVVYKPTDEEYQKILNQVGGLKVGETKSVPALSEK